jgi:hypothetical protein
MYLAGILPPAPLLLAFSYFMLAFLKPSRKLSHFLSVLSASAIIIITITKVIMIIIVMIIILYT